MTSSEVPSRSTETESRYLEIIEFVSLNLPQFGEGPIFTIFIVSATL